MKKAFATSENEQSKIYQRVMAHLPHQEIAAEQVVAIVDQYVYWFVQTKSVLRLRAERKKIIMAESQRLRQIEGQLSTLARLHDGLLGKITEKGWNLVTVLSLRHQYEKRLRALSKEEASSPVKRLAIFEEVTREFRDQHIEKSIPNTTQPSLVSTQAIAKEIDTLLGRFFELTNVQKNQLVLQMKEYRELVQKRSVVLHASKTSH